MKEKPQDKPQSPPPQLQMTRAQAEAIYLAAQAEWCRRYFYAFVRQAYPVTYSERFIDGWHIAVSAYAIQALYEGTLLTLDGKPADVLVINEPPGIGKSRLACSLAPSWDWTRHPEHGHWFTSFGQGLCDRDALDTRQLITSDWYRQRFWRDVHLMDDANQRRRYNTNKGGWRLSASIESRVGFGEHPAILTCVPRDGIITTNKGQLRIGDIVDDKMVVQVASFKDSTGVTELRSILEYERHPGRPIVEFQLSDGKTLTLTEDHLVFLPGEGGYYRAAGTLHVGTRLLSVEGHDVQVSAIARPEKVPRYVYNLRIADNHNYFVNGVLVHNCDDPHDPEQGLSSTLRQIAIDTWTNKFSTRGIVKGVKKLIIAQRLHEEDLSGYVLANEEGVAHLCLAMEFEPERRCTVRMTYSDLDDCDPDGAPKIKHEWTDPRTEPGQLLWPVGMDAGKVSKLKKRLRRAHAIAGQLQQRPSAPEGDMFQNEWLSYVDTPPACFRAVRGWDKASSTGRRNDFTAGALWLDDGQYFYIADIARGKWEMNARDKRIHDFAEADAGRWADYTIVYEQEGASGGKDAAQLAAQQTHAAGFKVRIVKAGNVKKEVRWEVFADALANGLVKIVRGDGNSWVSQFTDELLSAPNGAHDDMVDAVVVGFRYMVGNRNRGRISRDLLGISPEEQKQLAADDAAAGKTLCENCVGLGCANCRNTGFVTHKHDDLSAIFDAACASREPAELGVHW